MLASVLPAQERLMACAMASSLTGRLRAPTGGPGPAGRRVLTTWRSLLKNVSRRRAATTLWAAGSGGVFARAMANAAAPDGAAGSPPGGPRVCIVGGGFGGLYTAVKLETLLWPRGTKPRVTLIDQAERFTFKPLLYELLTGAASADEVAPPYSQLLASYAVTFVRGRVAAVRPDGTTDDGGSEGGGTVVLDSGDSVPYDWLVLALGSETNTFGVAGVREHAVPFATYADAARVAAKLDALDAAAGAPEVVVVGGGYAGVELAAAVAERLRGRGRIQLVTAARDILQGSPEGQREAAKRALQDDGVAVIAGAAVTEIRAAAAGASATNGSGAAAASKRLVYVKDADGLTEILEADLVVWAAGQAPTPRVEASSLALPFPSDAGGAMETDATLRVLRHRRVFALGDVAVRGVPAGSAADGTGSRARLPATAQVAFQQADYVAWNLWASMNDRPLLRFSYQHLGDMMSLGPTRGAVSLPIAVPPPLSAAAQSGPLGELLRLAGVRVSASYGGAADGVTVEGPLGAALRRAAYLYRQPTDEQRFKVAATWAGQATKAAAEVARRVLAGAASTDDRR